MWVQEAMAIAIHLHYHPEVRAADLPDRTRQQLFSNADCFIAAVAFTLWETKGGGLNK